MIHGFPGMREVAPCFSTQSFVLTPPLRGFPLSREKPRIEERPKHALARSHEILFARSAITTTAGSARWQQVASREDTSITQLAVQGIDSALDIAVASLR